MHDLIWVGNTLLPRWLVILSTGTFVSVLIFLFIYLTDEGT